MGKKWVVAEEITADRLNNTDGNPTGARTRARATLGLGVYSGGPTHEPMNFDTVDFDDDSNFDSFNITGTNTSTATNKLIDTGANFTSAYLNRIVYNVTDRKYARITNIDSTTQVTLSSISDGANIFPSSPVDYRIFGNRWTCKVAGYYRIAFRFGSYVAADQEVSYIYVYKNGSQYDLGYASASTGLTFIIQYNDIIKLDVGDYLEFMFAMPTARTVSTAVSGFSISLDSQV